MVDPTLRDQLAEALRTAPVRGTALRMTVLTELYGPVDALADAALAVAQRLLDTKDTEIERLREQVDELNTELAGWQLHYDPPPRPVVSTADISDYEEQTWP